MVQKGKDMMHPDNSFPYCHSLSPAALSVSLSLASSPEGGAKGVDQNFLASQGIYAPNAQAANAALAHRRVLLLYLL